jgi:hypothetical protein
MNRTMKATSLTCIKLHLARNNRGTLPW